MSGLLSRLIVLPVTIVAVLTVLCAVYALASPRVFIRLSRRFLAAIAFLVYAGFILREAAFVGDVGLYATPVAFMSWLAQIIPPAMCLWLMAKIERERTGLPLKHDFARKLGLSPGE